MTHLLTYHFILKLFARNIHNMVESVVDYMDCFILVFRKNIFVTKIRTKPITYLQYSK